MITLKEDFMVKALFLSKEIILKQFVSDVLGIPMEEIFSVRIGNPYLRKRYRRHKQGILDILLVLNGEAKINIELQIKAQKECRKGICFIWRNCIRKSYVQEKITAGSASVSVSAYWILT